MNDAELKNFMIELLATQYTWLALEANKRIQEKKGDTFFILEPETYIECCEDFAKKYLTGDIEAKNMYKKIIDKLRRKCRLL